MISIPEVKLVETSLLQEDGHNPNKMDKKSFEALKKNIIKYGFLIPVITNKDYLVADGSHRLKAAKELKLLKVPVIAIPLKEVDRRIIRQVMNKLRGEHDKELDDEEYKFIFDEGSFEEFKELCCFDDKELVSFLDGKGEVVEDDFDTTEALTKPKYEVKLCDVWSLGSHRLMCGDSTKSEDVGILMQEEKADISFTSPPYNVGHGLGYDKNSKYENSDDNMKNYANFLCETTNLSNKNARYSFVNLQFLQNNKIEIIKYLNLMKDKFVDIVFWKKLQVAPATPKNVMNSQVECIFIFSEENNNRAIRTGNFKSTVSNIVETNSASGENKNSKIHNATFPLKFVEYFINNFTKEDNVILDLFGGSGSTLIAAEQLNRKCYMMELEPKYCDVIIQRYEELTGKKAKKI
jgi:DNA modification methylase